MLRRICRMQVVFFAMFLTILFAACSLVSLYRNSGSVVNLPVPSSLSLYGTYVTDENEELQPLSGRFSLPRRSNLVTATGHFSRDIPENEIISLRLNNMAIRIFVNDELIYSYGQARSVLPNIKSSGNGWQYLPSPGILTSDTVKIELQNHYTNSVNACFNDFFNNIFVGNPVGQISQHLQSTLLRNLAGIFILFIGFLELVYAVALARTKENAKEYFMLAGLSIFASVWFLIDFNITGLFLPYPVMNNALQTLSLCLTGLCLLLYTGMFLTGKRRSCSSGYAIIFILCTIVTIYAQHFTPLDYYDFSTPIYMFMAGGAILTLLLLILERKIERNSLAKQKLTALFLLLVGTLLDIAFSYIGFIPFIIFQISFFLFNCWHLYIVWKSVHSLAREKATMHILREDHARQQRLLEYQVLLSQSTKGLYESIFEMDITHNCAGDDGARRYFENSQLPGDTPFDTALQLIAQTQVHEDFRQGYLNTFSREKVLDQFAKGIDTLQYDFKITKDGERYHWIRINARLFGWRADKSVRMIIYRQNIDEEKERELFLTSRAELDPLTGALNRETLGEKAGRLLEKDDFSSVICCIILDIDHFKDVNDTHGHMAGDMALIYFANALKNTFRASDIIGRLGGDEFIVFLQVPDISVAKKKAESLLGFLASAPLSLEYKELYLSTSIGISSRQSAMDTFDVLYKNADDALYLSKKNGRNRYTVYSD